MCVIDGAVGLSAILQSCNRVVVGSFLSRTVAQVIREVALVGQFTFVQIFIG